MSKPSPKRPTNHSEKAAGSSARRMLTVPEICDQLRVSRSTFYEWHAKNRGPACLKLPNRGLRVRQAALDAWLDALEEGSDWPELAGAATRVLLTVAEVCTELRIAESTFYDWRAKGRGLYCIKLPNGALRIRQDRFDFWIQNREDAA
jgi:excisionase family DNA binding protein